jgi:hypothetical protein
MQRAVFEKSQVDGFRTTRVETIACIPSGKNIFVGTFDGSLILYEFHPETAYQGHEFFSNSKACAVN